MRRLPLLIGLVLLSVTSSRGFGQVSDTARTLQLNQRLQELNGLELDTRLLANTDIPSINAPSSTSADISPRNIIPSTIPTTTTTACANTNSSDISGPISTAPTRFSCAAASQYNDYNAGDSFDGFGSRLINPDFDRAYYSFDLQRYESAYNGKFINYDVNFEGGRDLVYWGNGLVDGRGD